MHLAVLKQSICSCALCDDFSQELFLLSAESTLIEGAANDKATRRSRDIRRELIRNRLRFFVAFGCAVLISRHRRRCGWRASVALQ